MPNWLRNLRRSTTHPIHPQWQKGQYVTYFLEREDGGWAGVLLRLLGRAEDGAWILCADFKTPLGECTAWFRYEPTGSANATEFPVRQEYIRRTVVGAADPSTRFDDPMNAVPLAMNLLLPRRWQATTESLHTQPRHASYPCGVDQVYEVITPGLGYQKHHHINPRVMLTGIACLYFGSSKNPMTATSFGLNDPTACDPNFYDDFVDLSHAKCVMHEGFSLTYPATWFLRPQPSANEQGAEHVYYSAQLGGNSCAIYCTVRLDRGAVHEISQKRDELVSRLSAPVEGDMGLLSPREGVSSRLEGGGLCFVSDLDNPVADGFCYTGVYSTNLGDRLAQVTVFGCIFKRSPRRPATLAEMEAVFRGVLESFRFSPLP
jgi:hypothetical protein